MMNISHAYDKFWGEREGVVGEEGWDGSGATKFGGGVGDGWRVVGINGVGWAFFIDSVAISSSS